MDAAATQYLRAHLLAIIANKTTSVVAISGPDWGAIVARANDLVLLDDDRPNSFF